MKKIVFPLLVFTPALVNAQASTTNDYSALFGILIIIAVCVVLFLAFRQAVLWYWKIEVIIKNQEKQIKLQAENNNILSEQITLYKRANNMDQTDY